MGTDAVRRALVLSLGLLCACTKAPELERTQPRRQVALEGTFYTESPDEIRFPVKVLFAIDCSLSMGDEINGQQVGSDPHFLRIEAVREFVRRYNSNENTSFEVMLWNNDVFSATRGLGGHPGFTKDPTEINRVLDAAYNDTLTDYLGTLDAVYADIDRDIRATANQEELTRTKYVVVFLSDGMSNVQGGRQPDRDIWNRVAEISQMAQDRGVGGFNFHTFLLLGMFPPTQEGQAARTLAEATLDGMAQRGDGQFRLFENAEAVDFINAVDMRLAVEYRLKYVVAWNENVRPGTELVAPDSDGDGLTDQEERARGTDARSRDTDADGLSDFFEVKASSPGHELDPLGPDSPCDARSDGVWPDTDDDGLNDCEEFVKGTNRRVVDTDADGIPDGIEFLAGTNPLQVEYTIDSDFDGAQDWREVQQHTNVLANDPKIRDRYAYHYDLVDGGLVTVDQGSGQPSTVRRYQFRISNIDLGETLGTKGLDAAALAPGENRIRLFVAEVPEDRPNSPPIFRLAEAAVTVGASADTVTLSPGDFRLMP